MTLAESPARGREEIHQASRVFVQLAKLEHLPMDLCEERTLHASIVALAQGPASPFLRIWRDCGDTPTRFAAPDDAPGDARVDVREDARERPFFRDETRAARPQLSEHN